MKIGNENFEKILFLKFELKFLFFKISKTLAIPQERNGKF
jgi:hypothetical protein